MCSVQHKRRANLLHSCNRRTRMQYLIRRVPSQKVFSQVFYTNSSFVSFSSCFEETWSRSTIFPESLKSESERERGDNHQVIIMMMMIVLRGSGRGSMKRKPDRNQEEKMRLFAYSGLESTSTTDITMISRLRFILSVLCIHSLIHFCCFSLSSLPPVFRSPPPFKWMICRCTRVQWKCSVRERREESRQTVKGEWVLWGESREQEQKPRKKRRKREREKNRYR